MNSKILYVESTYIPLFESTNKNLNESAIINPITNEPYNGIILEGIFACLKPSMNNNRRIYDIPEYLKLVDVLEKQIKSPKGVYGELEHPKRYSVDYNFVSHKLIDIWWNPETLCVQGKVLLLNTPNGLKAQEIVKSGGQLAISARASGEEINQPDGSKKAIVKLLVTYDLVYHPGFGEAILTDISLNESIHSIGYNSQLINLYEEGKIGFNKILNESIIENIDESKTIRNIVLNESDNQQELTKSEEDKLQNVEAESDDKYQNKLKKEAESLDESNDSKINSFFRQVDTYQRHQRLDKTYFDGSAGFIAGNVNNGFISQSKNSPRKNRKKY